MIEQAGDILNAYEAVKAIHPEARWDVSEDAPYTLLIQIPATFNVEEFMSGMGELLREA